jgi:DNA repair exonuclease SbcCD nuclease subunit
MKIALITDTHYNFKKANKNFHDYFAKFYKEIFFPYLKENNIKTVIHLGDAFDNRKGVDYWALKWAKENVYDNFLKLGISVYSIVGNHDTYYKNTNQVNSIDILLDSYSNVIKISSPKEITIDGLDVLLLPWICPENQESIFNLLETTESKVVFGHLELCGFSVFPGQLQPHGMDKKIFNKFDKVFSGHYHTKSDDGKIFYIGNPYQMFWNDYNDKRGFNIFDTETLDLNFIENPHTIFEKIYYEDTNINSIDKNLLKDKIIKLIVRKKTNQKKFDLFLDELSKVSFIELKVSEILDIDDSNYQCSELDVEDTMSILTSYIEDSEFNLDKNLAKRIIKDVYMEALEVE